tara:strand:+ start:2873 stop:3157 length:285 start_codon:yes stop_codon:yes gene_type:complete
VIPIELYTKEIKMEKNGKYPSKGMNALASKRPDVAKKIMGYNKGGDIKVDEVIRMPQEIQVPGMMGGGMMYKDGGDVETVTQGHKGVKNTVKYR